MGKVKAGNIASDEEAIDVLKYQFPMGKVKTAARREKFDEVIVYQFPMGKVKFENYHYDIDDFICINSQWER